MSASIQAGDGFEFIADNEGCHSVEEYAAKQPAAPKPESFDAFIVEAMAGEDDGHPEFRRLGEGGVVNARNGRAVRPRFCPFLDGHGLSFVFLCYDGNPADPAVKPGTDCYRAMNRGVVEDPDDALAWLLGKWPQGLEFVEGLSERLSG